MAGEPEPPPSFTQERSPPTDEAAASPSTRRLPSPDGHEPVAVTPAITEATRVTDLPDEPIVAGRPVPGQRLGDFQLLEVLGSGSFATVYLAQQISLGRQVALKVATNQDSEARTLASLEHEH